MLFQFSYIQEIKFLCILAVVSLGWQASALFFYNYFKLKDKKSKLKLNRILLSYAFLILMGMFTIFFLAIITLMIAEGFYLEFLRKMTYASVVIALIFFWYYVSSKDFSDLFNPLITRLFLISSIVLFVVIMLLDAASEEFTYILALLGIEGLFLVWFQIKVTLNSSGTVKRRFFIILIAGLLVAIGLGLGANTALHVLDVSLNVYDLMFYTSVILFVSTN